MGFAVPDPYAWDESFRVDYDNLDDAHKEIFKGLFECSGDPGDAAKLSSLIAVTRAHFTEEEGMMDKANYSEKEGHKKLHVAFLETLDGLKTPLPKDALDGAKDWLVQHIKSVDFKYKTKL